MIKLLTIFATLMLVSGCEQQKQALADVGAVPKEIIDKAKNEINTAEQEKLPENGDKQMDWKFDQARNVATVTTKKVMLEKYPILLVIHYAHDESWAFTCGTTNKSEDLMLVSMGQVVDLDPTLSSIADLPPGWSAERKSVNSAWVRTKDE